MLMHKIPEMYRERVLRLVTAAEANAAAKAWPEDVEHACREARAATLAPFLAIAKAADQAALLAYLSGRDKCKAADEAEAEVWAVEIAKLDGNAS